MQRLLAALLFLSGVGICLSGIMDRKIPIGNEVDEYVDENGKEIPFNATENGEEENRFYHISEFNSTENGVNRWGGGYFPYSPNMPNSFFPQGSNYPYSSGGCSQYCVNHMGMPECCDSPISQIAPYIPRCPYQSSMCFSQGMPFGIYSMPCRGHMECIPAQLCCFSICTQQHVCMAPQRPGHFMFPNEFPQLG
ncbi:uncharacterized protein [Palaemon carinicauda]|uniref:uncharacterized protein n=1 Tax=Palaemon carinicauda TaxID=392227 RepID=UPI0035B641E3